MCVASAPGAKCAWELGILLCTACWQVPVARSISGVMLLGAYMIVVVLHNLLVDTES